MAKRPPSKSTWQTLSPNVRRALTTAIESNVPSQSLAFYARWWQLETWLRWLVYTELSAAHGRSWIDHLAPQAASRADREAVENAYMASPDSADLLTFLDVSHLFAVIDARWDLFASYLPPLVRWQGAVDELRQLRHRSAHCRRPHPDDLARLEQRLRDLEPGALRAVRSYHREFDVNRRLRDPVVKGWHRQHHPVAARLVDHAWRQYETSIRVSYTLRPWATPPTGRISGTSGAFWYVRFQGRGGRYLLPQDFWGDYYLDRPCAGGRPARDYIVHAVQSDPTGLTATFAAADAADAVSDAIGACFDAFLGSGGWDGGVELWDTWDRETDDLDSRVQVHTPLARADLERDHDFAIFG
jgi:Swt1-like HEPN